MPILNPSKITFKQKEYIEQLSIDLQFTRKQRNVHIQSILFKQIQDLDDLGKFEASKVIDKFKEWKENKKSIEQSSENQV